MNHKDINRLIKYEGIPRTLMIVAEELAELIQAVSKWYRTVPGKQVARENMIEEMADVAICMSMLCDIANITDEEVNAEIERKMKRNLERIGR